MTFITDLYDKLPRWVRVSFWVVLAGALNAVANAVSSGQIPVDVKWFALINIAIVAAKDFVNSKEKQ